MSLYIISSKKLAELLLETPTEQVMLVVEDNQNCVELGMNWVKDHGGIEKCLDARRKSDQIGQGDNE